MKCKRCRDTGWINWLDADGQLSCPSDAALMLRALPDDKAINNAQSLPWPVCPCTLGEAELAGTDQAMNDAFVLYQVLAEPLEAIAAGSGLSLSQIKIRLCYQATLIGLPLRGAHSKQVGATGTVYYFPPENEAENEVNESSAWMPQ